MSLLFYKILHILGLLLAFSALGALIFEAHVGRAEKKEGRRLTGIAHGVGLILLLVSGFGMLAKLGVGFPGWAVAKLVIWLVIGGIIALIRRKPQWSGILWFALPVLGTFAGYLALYKPF